MPGQGQDIIDKYFDSTDPNLPPKIKDTELELVSTKRDQVDVFVAECPDLDNGEVVGFMVDEGGTVIIQRNQYLYELSYDQNLTSYSRVRVFIKKKMGITLDKEDHLQDAINLDPVLYQETSSDPAVHSFVRDELWKYYPTGHSSAYEFYFDYFKKLYARPLIQSGLNTVEQYLKLIEEIEFAANEAFMNVNIQIAAWSLKGPEIDNEDLFEEALIEAFWSITGGVIARLGTKILGKAIIKGASHIKYRSVTKEMASFKTKEFFKMVEANSQQKFKRYIEAKPLLDAGISEFKTILSDAGKKANSIRKGKNQQQEQDANKRHYSKTIDTHPAAKYYQKINSSILSIKKVLREYYQTVLELEKDILYGYLESFDDTANWYTEAYLLIKETKALSQPLWISELTLDSEELRSTLRKETEKVIWAFFIQFQYKKPSIGRAPEYNPNQALEDKLMAANEYVEIHPFQKRYDALEYLSKLYASSPSPVTKNEIWFDGINQEGVDRLAAKIKELKFHRKTEIMNSMSGITLINPT